jgi:hypothetical protein
MLLTTYVYELKEQLVVATKRKSRKRKWIQQGGTIEYRTAAAQVAAKASTAPQRSKKACSSSDQGPAQPALQRCRNCSRTGYNMHMCKKDTEISSKSDESTTDIGSLFNSDEIEDV